MTLHEMIYDVRAELEGLNSALERHEEYCKKQATEKRYGIKEYYTKEKEKLTVLINAANEKLELLKSFDEFNFKKVAIVATIIANKIFDEKQEKSYCGCGCNR